MITIKIFTHGGLTRGSKPNVMPTLQSLQLFQNDMRAVIFQECPEAWKAYIELSQYGHTLVAGSGVCLFIACESHQEINIVYQQVSQLYETYHMRGLDIHPLFYMI